jgi:adenylosuccinate lyase
MVALEGMVAEGERDGREWKAEWAAVPDACLLAGAALDLSKRLLAGLQVNVEAMRANALGGGGMLASERLLAVLAPAVGKHEAQQMLQIALGQATSLEEALKGLDGLLSEQDRAALTAPDPGSSGAMVDEVVRRGAASREKDPQQWP